MDRLHTPLARRFDGGQKLTDGKQSATLADAIGAPATRVRHLGFITLHLVLRTAFAGPTITTTTRTIGFRMPA